MIIIFDVVLTTMISFTMSVLIIDTWHYLHWNAIIDDEPKALTVAFGVKGDFGRGFFRSVTMC